jgi:hypothetical protein
MNKPDTKAIREWMSTPIRSLHYERHNLCVPNESLVKACDHARILCDYIDSLPSNTERLRAEIPALDYYRFAVRPRIQGLPPEGEPINGQEWVKESRIKEAEDRVRAEIRAFVVSLRSNYTTPTSDTEAILGFIDNGSPKKPTATEIIDNTVAAWGLNGKRTNLSRDIHQQLMQAGYLPDTETVAGFGMTHEEQVEAWERDNELLRNLDVPELTFEKWVEYGELADQEAAEEARQAGANRSTYNNAMKETE